MSFSILPGWGRLFLLLLIGTLPVHGALQPIRLSPDGSHFVVADKGQRFVPWGFNFVGEHGTVMEEYWAEDWPGVEEDFANMKRLGANVVRVHLQLGTYMETAEKVRTEELDRLRKLLDLAERTGLYLDLTGLGCYHLKHVPAWLDALPEAERWDVQARFWEAIARTCAGHPAVFCYDLMNEPVIGGPARPDEHPWLGRPLSDFYFVQRISKDPGKRDRLTIAEAWVGKMVRAIRGQDKETLVTVGVIPWAHVWPNAKPLFYAPEIARHLDFVSVHFYPKAGEVEKAIAALKVYDIGKPLVVEEIFPMSCSVPELDRFIDQSRDVADGWISHYFGVLPGDRKPSSIAEAMQDKGVEHWRDKAAAIRRP